MGSGYKVFTSGAVLTASDLNNFCQEQTVMYFANTTARDTAITSPEDGMTVYIGSNDANEGLYTYNGTAWRKGPGWNAPWGILGVATVTTETSGSARTNVGLSITTPTLPANRRLRWTVYGHYRFDSVNDVGQFDIVTGSSGGSVIQGASIIPVGAPNVSNAQAICFTHVETTTSSAALTRRVTLIRSGGTSGDVKFFAGSDRIGTFICEDIGPSGAPA
jgi:hypothetical protein